MRKSNTQSRSETVNMPKTPERKGRAGYGGRVVRRAGIDGPPISYVTDGDWPYGTIDNPVAGYAQEVARRLAKAIGEKSFRSVARQAGVDHTTIMAVVRGERWPDLITLARLEVALEARLWPGGDS